MRRSIYNDTATEIIDAASAMNITNRGADDEELVTKTRETPANSSRVVSSGVEKTVMSNSDYMQVT